jgi:hypothetical protein
VVDGYSSMPIRSFTAPRIPLFAAEITLRGLDGNVAG